MNSLYPLKFKPLFLDKIWGGQKIKTVLGQDVGDLPNCGEAWVLSGVDGNQTLVSDGFLEGNELNELIEIYMGDLVGDQVYEKYGSEFPILVKILDTNDYLSIQVHPDDELANKRHAGNGKTEMWYVIQADEDAELITGFKTKIDKEEYSKLVDNKTLKNVLNIEKVKDGQVFYTPAGRVHALGPGLLIAEIQQTSDITYRIYDWDRIDHRGLSRELHNDLALDAIDFRVHDDYQTHYTSKENGTASLVKSQFFNTGIININKSIKKDYTELDSFVIHFCTQGSYELGYDHGNIHVKAGDCVLIPNELNTILMNPKPMAQILEVYIA
jgi:mannose-6-phosphate isomerase